MSEDEIHIQIIEILNRDYFFTKALAATVDQADYDGLAKALVDVSIPFSPLPLLRAAIEGEFERNFRAPSSILRGNSAASKMMGLFCRRVALDWAARTLGPVLQGLADPSLDLEVDPERLPPDAVLSDRHVLLQRWAERVLDALVTHAPELPASVRALARATNAGALRFAADRALPLVGGFLVLRFVNPCIAAPDSVGLLAKVSPRARRNLTLVSKLLQNLSNGVRFGAKERFVMPLNTFLDANEGKMRGFLEHVLAEDGPVEAADPEIEAPVTRQRAERALRAARVERGSLRLLHRLLRAHVPALREHAHELEMASGAAAAAHAAAFLAGIEASEPPSASISPSTSTPSGAQSHSPATETGGAPRFLVPVLKTGTITTPKRLRGQHRYFLSLTENFLHFFHAADGLSPHKSVPVDAMSGAPAAGDPSAFELTYREKSHLSVASTAEDARAWRAALRDARERKLRRQCALDAAASPRPPRGFRALLGGADRLYRVYFFFPLDDADPGDPEAHGFSDDDDGELLQFRVEAFGGVWTLRRAPSSLPALRTRLRASHPRLIVPAAPRPQGAPRERRRAALAFFQELMAHFSLPDSAALLDFWEVASLERALTSRNEAHVRHVVGTLRRPLTRPCGAYCSALHLAVLLPDPVDPGATDTLPKAEADLERELERAARARGAIAPSLDPLHAALRARRTRRAAALLRLGAPGGSTNARLESAWHLGARAGAAAFLRFLRDTVERRRAAAEKEGGNGGTRRHGGSLGAFAPFSEAWEPDVRGRPPLAHALLARSEDCVEVLLSVGPELLRSAAGPSALSSSSSSTSSPSSSMTSTPTRDPRHAVLRDYRDERGRSLLALAASLALPRALRALVRAGAADAPDRLGRTALHWAVLGGNADSLRLLLALPPTPTPTAGAVGVGVPAPLPFSSPPSPPPPPPPFPGPADLHFDVNVGDRLGDTALHLLASPSLPESTALRLLPLLLAGGARSRANARGRRALHEAARRGRAALARALPAPVAAVDAEGATPLHLARDWGCALALAARDLKALFAEDRFGETPRQSAERAGNSELADRLRELELRVESAAGEDPETRAASLGLDQELAGEIGRVRAEARAREVREEGVAAAMPLVAAGAGSALGTLNWEAAEGRWAEALREAVGEHKSVAWAREGGTDDGAVTEIVEWNAITALEIRLFAEKLVIT